MTCSPRHFYELLIHCHPKPTPLSGTSTRYKSSVFLSFFFLILSCSSCTLLFKILKLVLRRSLFRRLFFAGFCLYVILYPSDYPDFKDSQGKRTAARTICLDLLNDREGVCLGDLHLNCIILSSLSFCVIVWGLS